MGEEHAAAAAAATAAGGGAGGAVAAAILEALRLELALWAASAAAAEEPPPPQALAVAQVLVDSLVLLLDTSSAAAAAGVGTASQPPPFARVLLRAGAAPRLLRVVGAVMSSEHYAPDPEAFAVLRGSLHVIRIAALTAAAAPDRPGEPSLDPKDAAAGVIFTAKLLGAFRALAPDVGVGSAEDSRLAYSETYAAALATLRVVSAVPVNERWEEDAPSLVERAWEAFAGDQWDIPFRTACAACRTLARPGAAEPDAVAAVANLLTLSWAPAGVCARRVEDVLHQGIIEDAFKVRWRGTTHQRTQLATDQLLQTAQF